MSIPSRILLADDEETFRTSVAVLLRREGFVCDTAGSGGEVAELLSHNTYDLLVTDLRMPGNAQLEVLQACESGNMPVIIVTAYPSVPTAVEAVRRAVVDYLVKPFDFEELLRAVRRALDTRRALGMLESLRDVLADGGAMARIARRAGGNGDGTAADALTPREREIVSALSSGHRVGAIAERLRVSEHTVRNHLKAVYRKLDVHSQVELLSRWHATAAPRTM
jgi:DNA-binding NarL/FixJ family response regulator